jgi:hypothetical protein
MKIFKPTRNKVIITIIITFLYAKITDYQIFFIPTLTPLCLPQIIPGEQPTIVNYVGTLLLEEKYNGCLSNGDPAYEAALIITMIIKISSVLVLSYFIICMVAYFFPKKQKNSKINSKKRD